MSAAKGAGSRKLAGAVAARIERDVVRRGWPTGEVLGSEPELLDRYGVSRGVLREAVRLVEHKQVARMRRGPSGGLVVTAPDASAVIDAVAVYAHHAGITLAELFEARRVVEGAATEMAARSLGELDLEWLRAQVAPGPEPEAPSDPHALHSHLARITGNAAIELFSDVATRLTALYVGSLSVSANGARRWRSDAEAAHRMIVDALLSGNGGLAGHRMRRHLDALEDFLRRRRASQTLGPALLGAGGAHRSKRAEEVAGAIVREVAERGWPVGEVLGSEAALVERYDISRAVLREAVRILEHHQVARTRRGPGGGLVVTEPGADAVAEAMTLYLEYRRIEPRQLHEARSVLELAAVTLAAATLDGQGAEALRACVAREQEAPRESVGEVGHDLHLLVGELSGNRLLSLFLRILVRSSARHLGPGPDPDEAPQEVRRAHRAVAEALLDGAADLARHRMGRHLDALAVWYR